MRRVVTSLVRVDVHSENYLSRYKLKTNMKNEELYVWVNNEDDSIEQAMLISTVTNKSVFFHRIDGIPAWIDDGLRAVR